MIPVMTHAKNQMVFPNINFKNYENPDEVKQLIDIQSKSHDRQVAELWGSFETGGLVVDLFVG